MKKATKRATKYQRDNARSDAVKRFLFQNGISLLTLLTLAFYAGEYSQRFSRLETVAQVVDAKTHTMGEQLNNVIVRLAVMDNDLSFLKGARRDLPHKGR